MRFQFLLSMQNDDETGQDGNYDFLTSQKADVIFEYLLSSVVTEYQGTTIHPLDIEKYEDKKWCLTDLKSCLYWFDLVGKQSFKVFGANHSGDDAREWTKKWLSQQFNIVAEVHNCVFCGKAEIFSKTTRKTRKHVSDMGCCKLHPNKHKRHAYCFLERHSCVSALYTESLGRSPFDAHGERRHHEKARETSRMKKIMKELCPLCQPKDQQRFIRQVRK